MRWDTPQWRDMTMEQRNAAVRERFFEEGKSYSYVAKELGTTRSAIAGVASRMRKLDADLQKRGKPTFKMPSRKRKQQAEALRQKFAPKPKPSKPLPPVERMSNGAVSLINLTNETCRWPVEGGYCGIQEADLAKRKPYCNLHSKGGSLPARQRRNA